MAASEKMGKKETPISRGEILTSIKEFGLPRPNSQQSGIITDNPVYIIIAVTLVAIALIVYLERQKSTSAPTQSATISPQETVLSPESTISKTHVTPSQLEPEKSTGQTELDTLRSLLVQHGWGVQRDSDSNLILVPGAVSTHNDGTSATAGFKRSQAMALASLLRPHGWIVGLDSSGDLILVPGMAVAATIADTGVTSPTENTGLTALRSVLEPYGWRVLIDPDEGGVLLVPGSPVETVSDMKTGNTEIQQGTDIESLRSLLTPHGWKLDTDATGATILIPN